MRVVTLGSDNPHPLTRATLEVLEELEGIDHADHLTARDAREFLRNARSEEYRAHVAALEPDLLISAAYAQVVPEQVLAIPKIGAINIHPSLLPEYRGVSAVWWALYEGRTRVGVTIHQMTVPVDTGPIVAQTAIDVTPDAEPVEVWRMLGHVVRPILKSTLEELRETGRISSIPQPEGGSYRSRPHKELQRLELDWSLPASELVRRDRIFPGCGNVPVLRWRILASSVAAAESTHRPPGWILGRRLRSLDVATGEGTSVRIELGRPLRDWAKLLLVMFSTGRLRRLPVHSGGAVVAHVASSSGQVS